MAYTPLGKASGVGSVTVDTTGASLVVIITSGLSGSGPTENKSNTISGPAVQSGVAGGNLVISYISNGTFGSNHTFGVTGSYGAIAVLWFSGTNSFPLSTVSHNESASASSIQLASAITPPSAGALMIWAGEVGNTIGTIDTDFGADVSTPGVSAVNYGVYAGFREVGTPFAVNPTLTQTGGAARMQFAVATFLPSTAPGAVTGAVIDPPANATGNPLAASGNFYLDDSPRGGTKSGSTVWTLTSSVPGDTFSPATITRTANTGRVPFTLTASSSGARTISATNNGGLSNPAGVTFTGNAVATITAAVVAANGNDLALTFSASVSTPTVLVMANGYPVAISALSGSGTSWNLNFGRRWINQADTITVVYIGATTTATNGSLVKGNQIKHVGRNFQMFIHWNNETFNNTGLGTGNESPNTFAPTGNPRLFVRQWAAACKLAGMSAAALTVKHHSGFGLWPSAASNYNLSASSWWVGAGSPDIVKIFAEEFRAAGLGVQFYFSIKDFHWESAHPSFTPTQYTALVVAQITELLTNYGPVDALWFDGWAWGAPYTGFSVPYSTVPWASVKAVRDALQPLCLIIGNNYDGTLTYSDIYCWEFPLLGPPPANNKFVGEACDTIELNSGNSGYDWFHQAQSYVALTAADIRSKIAYYNGNNYAYRLNCGPDTSGYLPAATIARLAEAGSTSFEVRNDPSASVVPTNPIAVGVDILTGHLVIPA